MGKWGTDIMYQTISLLKQIDKTIRRPRRLAKIKNQSKAQHLGTKNRKI